MEGQIVRTYEEELQHWSEACIREKQRSGLDMFVVMNERDHEMQNWPVRDKIPEHWKILFCTNEELMKKFIKGKEEN